MHISQLRRQPDELEEDDQRGCVLLMVLIALVSVSGVLSWREMRYLVQGQTTDAKVLRVYEVHGRGAGTIVDFELVDPHTGEVRRHSDRLPLGWRPASGPLAVQFIPGTAAYARVAGYTNRWALWVFAGLALLAMGYVGLLARDARRPPRRRPG